MAFDSPTRSIRDNDYSSRFKLLQSITSPGMLPSFLFLIHFVFFHSLYSDFVYSFSKMINYRSPIRYSTIIWCCNWQRANWICIHFKIDYYKYYIDIINIFFKIRANHGEGIILRDPSAPYVPGYSHHIYKHKVYY